ncbi:hypothetical protein GALL_531190 [mine drainage metagenome]|uniref:Glycosyl transferase family 1 domain-containing protein n=1 Tax=mine drainage metagenome TaxID=410659 RepID=A0A1J5PCU6_9ZZZZ
MGPIGALARIKEIRGKIESTQLIHARSDVPAVASLLSAKAPVLWDVRSLWSDQRVFMETEFFKRQLTKGSRVLEWYASGHSKAMSTLTYSVVPELEARYRQVPKLRIVVPTAVDLSRFQLSEEIPQKIVGLYSGTFNSYYDLNLSKRFTDELNAISPTVVHWARPRESSTKILGVGESHIFESSQNEMAEILSKYSFGLSVCKLNAGPSLKAAMPTKVAEFLACGRPVVVSKGLGDFDKYLPEFEAGVILDGTSDNLRSAVHKLTELISDPETPGRCRALAEKYFDIDKGAEKYLDLYSRM